MIYGNYYWKTTAQVITVVVTIRTDIFVIFAGNLYGSGYFLRLVITGFPTWGMRRLELMLTCLVWAEQSTPDSFGVPSHRFNSARIESVSRKASLRLFILTPSRPVGCLINDKRQVEKRRPPSFYVSGVTRSGIEPRPPAPRADALTTRLCGGSLDAVGLCVRNLKYLAEGRQATAMCRGGHRTN